MNLFALAPNSLMWMTESRDGRRCEAEMGEGFICQGPGGVRACSFERLHISHHDSCFSAMEASFRSEVTSSTLSPLVPLPLPLLLASAFSSSSIFFFAFSIFYTGLALWIWRGDVGLTRSVSAFWSAFQLSSFARTWSATVGTSAALIGALMPRNVQSSSTDGGQL